MKPEEALERAREEAAAARARGEHREPPVAFEVARASRIDDWRLTEWAMIEPDEAKVYSTRRFGAPITWLKRALIRVLRQYHGQILSQQSRFNAQVAAHLHSIDDRLRDLERRVAELEPGDPGGAPPPPG
jgi:hypothetical protein